MKKNWLLLGALTMAVALPVMADDFEDDIYYNPSKSSSHTSKKKSSGAYYIKDFDLQDVDEYNRRGQYYATPVDTIGDYVASGEDFVYTQKIQRFYNPTIVVDNAAVLQSVLDNSYGNVEVVYNIDGPVFSSYYSPFSGYYPGGWYSPYYYSTMWNPRWYPSWTWSAGWGLSWNFGPGYWCGNIGWGPSWGYGPGWGWGGYYPPRPPHNHYHGPAYAWTPGRNSVNRPGTPHGAYTYNGGTRGGYTRPGSPVGRPGSVLGSTRPGTSVTRPGTTTRPGGTVVGGTRPSTTRPAGTSVGGTRGSTRRHDATSSSSGRGSSSSSSRGSSSVGHSSSSSSSGSTYRSSSSNSSSRGSSSAGRSSGSSGRSSGGRGGRR